MYLTGTTDDLFQLLLPVGVEHFVRFINDSESVVR